MSDDEILALIALCEDAIATDNWARLWLTATPNQIMELARDALRFRWLLARHSETEAAPDTPDAWLHFIGWAREVRTADIRSAIDDGMEQAP